MLRLNAGGLGGHHHRTQGSPVCSVPSCWSVGAYEVPALSSQRPESDNCGQGANTQDQGLNTLKLRSPAVCGGPESDPTSGSKDHELG